METILIADDHEIVRRGVRVILESLPQKYNYIEATTCTEVMKALRSQPVKYAILDMYLTDGNVFTAIEHITDCYSRTKVLAYSMNAEKIYALRFIKKGIRGFVSKQASIKDLEIAIRALLNGEIYLSPELTQTLLRPNQPDRLENPIDSLSDRELEVIEYVATGMGTKEIANKLHLDIATISTYRRRAFEKLDVRNMIELKEKFFLYKMQG